MNNKTFLYQGIEEDDEPTPLEIDGADLKLVSGYPKWNYPLFLLLAN